MMKRIALGVFLLLPVLGWANACTLANGSSASFRLASWASCGGTYPQPTDTFTISASGTQVFVPNGESDSVAGFTVTSTSAAPTGVANCGPSTNIRCTIDVQSGGTFTTTGASTIQSGDVVSESGGTFINSAALAINSASDATAAFTALSLSSGTLSVTTASNAFNSGDSVALTGIALNTSTFTGNTDANSPVITAVSSLTGLVVGQVIYDANISSSQGGAFPQGEATILSIDSVRNAVTLNVPARLAITGDTFTVDEGAKSWTNNLIQTVASTGNTFGLTSIALRGTPTSYSGSDTGTARRIGTLQCYGVCQISGATILINLTGGAIRVGAGGQIQSTSVETSGGIKAITNSSPPYGTVQLEGSGWTGQTGGSAVVCGSGSGVACMNATSTNTIQLYQTGGGVGGVLTANYAAINNVGTTDFVSASDEKLNHVVMEASGGELNFVPQNATDLDTMDWTDINQRGMTISQSMNVTDTTPRDASGNLRRCDKCTFYNSSATLGRFTANGPHVWVTNGVLAATRNDTNATNFHGGTVGNVVYQVVNSNASLLFGEDQQADGTLLGNIFLAFPGATANFHLGNTAAASGSLGANLKCWNIYDGGNASVNASNGYINQIGLNCNNIATYMGTPENNSVGASSYHDFIHNSMANSTSSSPYQQIISMEGTPGANKFAGGMMNLLDTVDSGFSIISSTSTFVPQHHATCNDDTTNPVTTSGSAVTVPLNSGSCVGTPSTADYVTCYGFTKATWLNGLEGIPSSASTSSVTFNVAQQIPPASYSANDSSGTCLFGARFDWNNLANSCNNSNIWNPTSNTLGCQYVNTTSFATNTQYMAATAISSVASTTQLTISSATNLAVTQGYAMQCSGDTSDWILISSASGTNPYTINYTGKNTSGGTGLATASCSGKNLTIWYPWFDTTNGYYYGATGAEGNETFLPSGNRDITYSGQGFVRLVSGNNALTNSDLANFLVQNSQWDESGNFVSSPSAGYNYDAIYDYFLFGFKPMNGALKGLALDHTDIGVQGNVYNAAANSQ